MSENSYSIIEAFESRYFGLAVCAFSVLIVFEAVQYLHSAALVASLLIAFVLFEFSVMLMVTRNVRKAYQFVLFR